MVRNGALSSQVPHVRLRRKVTQRLPQLRQTRLGMWDANDPFPAVGEAKRLNDVLSFTGELVNAVNPSTRANGIERW